MTGVDWDVVVIGRSFGGLSAALTLGRCRRSVLVIGTGGPRNAAVRHAHGLLTQDGGNPTELIAIAETQLDKYPSVAIIDGRVDTVAAVDSAAAVDTVAAAGRGGPGFRVTFDGRTVTASAVIVATGVNDDPPAIPGLAEHWGRGVYTCPFCDGFENQDTPLVVVGVPAWAPHTATMLLGWSSDVSVFVDGLEPDVAQRLRNAGIVVDSRSIRRVIGEGGRACGLELDDGSTLAIGAIFCAKLPIPNSALAVALGCGTDDFGLITVDAQRRTTVDGVWAVGDVTSMRHQMAFAIADGAAAAADCHMALTSRLA